MRAHGLSGRRFATPFLAVVIVSAAFFSLVAPAGAVVTPAITVQSVGGADVRVSWNLGSGWSRNGGALDIERSVNGGAYALVRHISRPRATGYWTDQATPAALLSYRARSFANGVPSAYSAVKSINRAPINQVPIASAGPDQSALTGIALTFNGAGSSDPDGAIASYSWNFGDGATATAVSPSASHWYASAGTYTATLTVVDNLGASDTDTATITVANRPPIANAGPDTGASVGAAVTLSGFGSDPDGTIVAYNWTFGDGTTGTGATPSHVYAATGAYTATLTVRDNNGATASDTAIVTVVAAVNRPPVANAGPDKSGTTGVAVALAGSGTDPDGDSLTYAWNFGDGVSAAGASVNHVYNTSGTYTATLTVSDNRGGTDTDTATITVSAPTGNRAPVANAGADKSGTTGVAVAFAGSGTDPDGDPLTYSWMFGDSATAAGANVNHVYTQPGSYTATLSVSDNRGGTDTDTVLVTITVANRPPVVNAGADKSVTLGSSVTLIGSATDPDGDGIASYQWAFGDGTTAGGAIASHVYATAGTYTATLTATDSRGLGATDTAIVTVNTVANQLPVANAGPDKTGTAGVAISLSGSGTDPDGSITAYSWSFGDGTTGTGATVNHTYTNAGTYTATLTVTDNRGGTDTDTATVTVSATPNQLPTANAGPDKSTTPGVAVTLTGSGSDPDGSITAYSWSFGDGTTGTGATVNHTYTNAGTYTATLTVTDNRGGSDTDIAIVAVGAQTSATWARAIGGSGSDSARGVATDSAGNEYVVGVFQGSMTVDGTTYTSAGYGDMYIVKFAPTGGVLWLRTWGGSADDSVQDVAVDDAGRVTVVGQFTNSLAQTNATTNLGGQNLDAAGKADMFVAQYNASDGGHRWSQRYGGPIAGDNVNAVVVDGAGNLFLTGHYQGSANFGGQTLAAAEIQDIDWFVAKLRFDGTHLWSKRFWNSGNDFGDAIAVDSAGDVMIAGHFTNSMSFIEPVTAQTLLSAQFPDTDVALAKLSGANGASVWARRLGGVNGPSGAGGDFAQDLAVDGAGNIVLAAQTGAAPADYGSGPMPSLVGTDVVIATYASSNGNGIWSRRFGGTGSDGVAGLAVSGSDIYFTGTSESRAMTVGGTTLVADFGQPMGYVAKLNAQGTVLSARQYGGTATAQVNVSGLAVANGAPVVAGFFRGTVAFEGTTLTSNGVVTNGPHDGFVVRGLP